MESLSTQICDESVTTTTEGTTEIPDITTTKIPDDTTTEFTEGPTTETPEYTTTALTQSPSTTEGSHIPCPPQGVVFLPDHTDCAKFYICAEGNSYAENHLNFLADTNCLQILNVCFERVKSFQVTHFQPNVPMVYCLIQNWVSEIIVN